MSSNNNSIEILAATTTTNGPTVPSATSASAAVAIATSSSTATANTTTTTTTTATPASVSTASTTAVLASSSDTALAAKGGGEESKAESNSSSTPSKENHQPAAVKDESSSSSSPPTKKEQEVCKKVDDEPKPKPIGRRSTRILEHDPIIAPGYGTRRDLLRLTAQLNSSSSGGSEENSGTTPILPLEAVELIMKSRGRGIRGDAAAAAAAAPAAAANTSSSSSAWADFMQEEGFGGSASKKEDAAAAAAVAKKEEEDASASSSAARKRSARTAAFATAAAATANHDEYDEDDDDEHAKRVYVLPPEWQEFDSFFTSSNSGRGGKGKKTKTETGGVGGGGGGILVQAGTLDATIVGRKSIGGGTGGGVGGKKKKGAAAPAAPAEAKAALYHCMSPTKLSMVRGANTIRVEKVYTSCNSVHTIATANHGAAVYGWGRNESQQLTAHLPCSCVPFPTLLNDFLPDDIASNGVGVASAATGKSHTILLCHNGTAYAVGSNKLGQCAVKSSIETIAQFKKVVVGDNDNEDSITLVQVACGEDFTMALDSNGYLYSAGCSQYGQLGNGETGEHFITANKLAFANCTSLKRRSTFCQEDISSSLLAGAASSRNSSSNKDQKIVPILQEDDILIQQVVCGKHHTVAVEASCTNIKLKPRVFTWGCGDYGCLGHGVQKDEYFPRLLDTIDRMAQIQGSSFTVAAGTHCGLLLTQAGHVYYWGKHRSVGEAVMRPQIVDALANNQHHVTHCAAGGATVICSTANAQTVAWGQGPHGELGFGTSKKSSSKPDFVTALTGCRVLDLAAGYGHTVYVVSNQDAEDCKALEKLDEIEHDDVQDLMDAAQDKQDVDDAAPKKKAGKKRG